MLARGKLLRSTIHSEDASREPRGLGRSDIEAELTKLLRHGYGSLVIKIYGHCITVLEATTRQRRNGRDREEPGC